MSNPYQIIDLTDSFKMHILFLGLSRFLTELELILFFKGKQPMLTKKIVKIFHLNHCKTSVETVFQM